MTPQGHDTARPRLHPFRILSAPRTHHYLRYWAALAPSGAVSRFPRAVSIALAKSEAKA